MIDGGKWLRALTIITGLIFITAVGIAATFILGKTAQEKEIDAAFSAASSAKSEADAAVSVANAAMTLAKAQDGR